MASPLISRVIVPAASAGLISLDDAKSALGIPSTDTSKDAAVQANVDAISAAIVNYCDREFVVQTYRDTFRQLVGAFGEPLRSRQWPIPATGGAPTLYTVTVDGVVIDPAAYDLDLSNGRAFLLESGWAGTAVLLDYVAGYDPIPPDVVAATGQWLIEVWSQRGRDPSTRSETVPDVISVVYRDDPSGAAGSSGEGPPDGVRDWLWAYRNWST
jgi:hypothetical protein